MNTTLDIECPSCEGPLAFEITDPGSPSVRPRGWDPGDPGSPPTVEGPALCPNRTFDDDTDDPTGPICGHDLRRDKGFQKQLLEEAEWRLEDDAEGRREEAALARWEDREDR